MKFEDKVTSASGPGFGGGVAWRLSGELIPRIGSEAGGASRV